MEREPDLECLYRVEFWYNMGNHLLELLFHGQISGVFLPVVVETDLAKIALSCHFALDLLCYQESGHGSA